MEGSWIEIARPGRFRDAGGAWHEFSGERLARMAAGYDPAKREAPLVLGHPTLDGPAHGWVKALKFNGRKLLACVASVTDEIREAVDNGLYKYVSMSLYQDDGLRHIGLLGATPPAIAGLVPVSFSGAAALTIDFLEKNDEQKKGRNMDEAEIQRKIGELEAKLAAALQERDAAQKKAADLEAKLGEGEKAAEAAAAEFAAYKAEREMAALTARLDRLVTEGRLLPAYRPAAEKVALALKAVPANFAEGSPSAKDSPLETYLTGLEAVEPSPLLASFSAPAGREEPEYKPLAEKL